MEKDIHHAHSSYVVQRSESGVAVSVHLPAHQPDTARPHHPHHPHHGGASSPTEAFGLRRNNTTSTTGSAVELHVAQRRSIPTQPIRPPTRFEIFLQRIRVTDVTKRKVWDFLDDPSSSPLAMGWSVLILLLIITSCAAFVLETEPSLCCGRYDRLWFTIEVVCVSFFTAEYVGRVLACPEDYGKAPPSAKDNAKKKRKEEAAQKSIFSKLGNWPRLRFIFSIMNLIDLVAIVPFYVELFASGSGANFGFVRVVRLARVFRLLKLGKYTEGLNLLSTTMRESMQGLGMLSFFLVIAVTLLSSAMFFAERGRFCHEGNDWCGGLAAKAHGHGWYYVDTVLSEGLPWCGPEDGWCSLKSEFHDILNAGYFVFASVTTLGYGDLSPVTTPGQVIGCLVMFCGLVILALPITVISTNFAQAYEDAEYRRLAAAHRQSNSISMASKAVQSLLARGKSVTQLVRRTMSVQDATALANAAKEEAITRTRSSGNSSSNNNDASSPEEGTRKSGSFSRFRFAAAKLGNGSSKRLLLSDTDNAGANTPPEGRGGGGGGGGGGAGEEGGGSGTPSPTVREARAYRRKSSTTVPVAGPVPVRNPSPGGRHGHGSRRASNATDRRGSHGAGGEAAPVPPGGVTIFQGGAPLVGAARASSRDLAGAALMFGGGGSSRPGSADRQGGSGRQASVRSMGGAHGHFRQRRSSSRAVGLREVDGGHVNEASPLDMFKDMEEEEAQLVQELLDRHCAELSAAIHEMLIRSTKDIVRMVLDELARSEQDTAAPEAATRTTTPR